MTAADTEALRMALGAAAVLGLIYLMAAVWIALDEQRSTTIEIRVDPAAWLISQMHENARQIIAEAAAERQARGELAP